MSILKNIKENKGRVTLAVVLVVSVVALSGIYFFMGQAKGAAITSLKAVLSTSKDAALANQTITFTLPAGNTWAAGETLTITYDTGFVLTSLANTDPLDYDIKTDLGGTPVDEAIVANAGCGATDSIEITSIAGQVITFTACGSYTAPPNGAQYEIEIGNHAALGGAGNTQITNPGKEGETVGTANIETIDLAGTIGANDTGTALVAIIEGIAVSVTVDESMTFSIAGVTLAACDSSFSSLPGVATVTTNAAVSFGTLVAGGGFNHACHDLTISTNAPSGYAISAEEDKTLTRTGADSADKSLNDAQGNDDSMTTTVEAAWTTTTKYGFAYSCEQASGGQGDCVITPDTDYRQFACRSAVNAECEPDPESEAKVNVATSAVPVNNKVSRIEYKINVDPVQPAGLYQNIITYIATPTF